ncbi:hypothetical protein Vretimale_8162 [Volvox reticuliferus]|uniref:Uncharacterized protein n=1 Tax=Volvox reticuliferus TaxID=1737510 RepID=A0A8J4LNZ2_9CHLO|nr:hypothetical protein Vretimale_8162 [Volvox reticuliferus]
MGLIEDTGYDNKAVRAAAYAVGIHSLPNAVQRPLLPRTGRNPPPPPLRTAEAPDASTCCCNPPCSGHFVYSGALRFGRHLFGSASFHSFTHPLPPDYLVPSAPHQHPPPASRSPTYRCTRKRTLQFGLGQAVQAL